VIQPKSPLHKFPLYSAGGVDSFGAALTPHLGSNHIEPQRRADAFNASLNLRRLQKTAICYANLEQPISVEIRESANFLHGFPLRGHGRHFNNGVEISDSPSKGAVGGPGPLKLSYGGEFEIVAIFISPASLSSALSALIGRRVGVELKLDKSNYSRPEARALRGIVRAMIAELDFDDAEPSPLLLAELEQAALVAFLCGTAHNHSLLLAAPPLSGAPWQLRRLEEYIEANWDQPITIEALSVVTNASARSIFHSFKEHRGYSPMSFVKQVRLKHAQQMLRGQAPGATVTAVAYACGFGNLGHFASDYLKAFGENPSVTRSRANGLR
jgi:AraC-like DNA-binding protein